MKRKLIIVGSLFITLVVMQVFSSGHGHVVVVVDNIQLTGENKKLTKSVSTLKAANKQLTEDKANLENMVSEVIGDLDSTMSVVKPIKKERANENDNVTSQTTGQQFEFQPITLPTSDGN